MSDTCDKHPLFFTKKNSWPRLLSPYDRAVTIILREYQPSVSVTSVIRKTFIEDRCDYHD